MRRWFFVANALLPLLNIAVFLANQASPRTTPSALLILVFGLSVAGFASEDDRLQGGVVLLHLLTIVVGFGGLLMQSA